MEDKIKVCVVSGTRADIGIYNTLLQELQNDKKFDLTILATAMHFSLTTGYTYEWLDEEYKDFKIHKIDAIIEGNSLKSMSQNTGLLIMQMAEYFSKTEYDFVILLGDRTEMFAAAYVCSNLNIKIAHIHGGEQSSSIDNNLRHAISKLSNIHFSATEISKQNLIKMGEKQSLVFNVGSLRVHEITHLEKFLTKEMLFKKYDIKNMETYFVFVFHPITNDDEFSFIPQIIDYLLKENHNIIWIYPNNDSGFREVHSVMDSYRCNNNIKFIKNLNPEDYLSLIKNSLGLIGNSSSGIIESPALKIKSLNIGKRQANREKTNYTLDLYDTNNIKEAIQKFIEYKPNSEKENVYYKKDTINMIKKTLSKYYKNNDILLKKLDY